MSNSYFDWNFFPTRILTNILMLPFNSNKVQTHSRFAFESITHGNEEHNEGGKMDVDLVVALESWPTEPKVTSNTEIFSDVVDNSSEAKGATPIPTSTIVEATTHFGGIIDPRFFQ